MSVIFLKSVILKHLFNREEFNLRHTATLHQRPKCSTPELASQQNGLARTASQLSTALLPQRKVRSGGTDETGGIPGGSALAGFFNDYGVLGRMPILIYIYSLLQALPGDRRYPDPLISHKPFLMVRLWIADQPRQRAHGQRRWVPFRVAEM